MEELTLDGLALHTSPFSLEAFDHTPAKKLLEWVKGADADGAKLLRAPKHETAEITLKVRVDQQATMDAALNAVGQLVDKLQEAERVSAAGGRGLQLVWSPDSSSFNGTFYVLAGEVEDIPKEPTGESLWFQRAPVVTVRLTCDPFLYGPEVTTSTTTSNAPLVLMTVADIPGDVPAEARFIVTDAAGQSRDFVAIGLENYSYNPATDLLLAGSGFVYTGFAGLPATRAGSYSNPSVIRATLTTTPVAVCSSVELTHVGTFHNYFRLWPSSTNVSVRMSWRQGRDQWTTEPWVQAPLSGNFWEVDLGECKVRPAALGTQTWQWRLEAKSTAPGDTVDVDVHAMVPSGEGYGKVRQSVTYETPTLFSARDEFDQTAGNLTGKTLPVGGTWAGDGDADDFTIDTAGRTAQRTVTGDLNDIHGGRLALAGTTAFTSTAVQADVKWSHAITGGLGLVARYTDLSNFYVAYIDCEQPTHADSMLVLAKRVGGTVTVAGGANLGRLLLNTTYSLRLAIFATGQVRVWCCPAGTIPSAPVFSTSDTALATGGALASGRAGIYDRCAAAESPVQAPAVPTRNYDNFAAFVPTVDAACFASQSLEFRSYGDDPALREDSTGTYWGRPPEVRGGRMWLPPAGDDDRTTRVAVLARRNDIETLPAANVTDSTSVAIAYRSRFLVVPQQA